MSPAWAAHVRFDHRAIGRRPQLWATTSRPAVAAAATGLAGVVGALRGRRRG